MTDFFSHRPRADDVAPNLRVLRLAVLGCHDDKDTAGGRAALAAIDEQEQARQAAEAERALLRAKARQVPWRPIELAGGKRAT